MVPGRKTHSYADLVTQAGEPDLWPGPELVPSGTEMAALFEALREGKMNFLYRDSQGWERGQFRQHKPMHEAQGNAARLRPGHGSLGPHRTSMVPRSRRGSLQTPAAPPSLVGLSCFSFCCTRALAAASMACGCLDLL